MTKYAEGTHREDMLPADALQECIDLHDSGAWPDSNAVYNLAEVIGHVRRLLHPENPDNDIDALTQRWEELTDSKREEERFSVSVRLLALLARKAFPNAATLRLETSDQGHHMTLSSVWLIDGDGTEIEGSWSWEQGCHFQAEEEKAEEVCGWISWADASNGDVPGWVVDNSRGGYYHIDIEEALK